MFVPALARVTLPAVMGHAVFVVALFPTAVFPFAHQTLTRLFCTPLHFLVLVLFDFVLLALVAVGHHNLVVILIGTINNRADDGDTPRAYVSAR